MKENAQPEIEAILAAPAAAQIKKCVLDDSSVEKQDKDSFEQRIRQIRELSEAPLDRMLVQSLRLQPEELERVQDNNCY